MQWLKNSTPDRDFADLAPLGRPRFLVSIDTEEEFNWGHPFSREQRGVTHFLQVDRFQNLCNKHDVIPIYLIDHPIASDPYASEKLARFAADGTASIGMHLHPWVTPPFLEEVSVTNSYGCNLEPELERAKLTMLHALILKNTGIKTDIYRAGRYGVGPNTPAVLKDLGVRIDTSVRTCFDYSADTGPNHSMEPVQAHWLERDELLEIPVTTVFGGHLRGVGQSLFSSVFNSSAARSILSRTALLERIALTPEGIGVEKARQGIDLALEQGVGILNLSFHSPSLAPGFTPYVRNGEDLERFYAWWEAIFAHLEKRGVKQISVPELLNSFFDKRKIEIAA
jgi:hypothetical protein